MEPFNERSETIRSNCFSDHDRKLIRTSENDQRKFITFIGESRLFSENERRVSKIDSITKFEEIWNQTTTDQKRFNEDHESGCGLFSKRYQHSAIVAQSFMENFSPIVDIVQSFAAPYGNLAFGTISVLLVVAKSKSDIEQRLGSMISAIKDRLPDLKVYQHIYNKTTGLDVSLQGQIALAYQNFMEFCMVATKYYKRSATRRWLGALASSNLLNDKADAVQSTLTEIRRTCEVLLHDQISTIKQINEAILKQNQDLQTKMEELQRMGEDNRVREFQALLELNSFSVEAQRDNLERYHHSLDSNECLNRYQKMGDAEVGQFKRKDKYQKWKGSTQPCALFLWGYNHITIYTESDCWLSPVAISIVKELHEGDFYAYNILESEKPIHAVFSCILLQLLRQRGAALQDEVQYTELHSEFEVYRQVSEKGRIPKEYCRSKLDALRKIAIRIINLFEPSDMVYIIIDRVDRCVDRTPGMCMSHQKELLNSLVKLVRVAKCKVKVLAVVNGYDWSMDKYQDVIDDIKDERILV